MYRQVNKIADSRNTAEDHRNMACVSKKAQCRQSEKQERQPTKKQPFHQDSKRDSPPTKNGDGFYSICALCSLKPKDPTSISCGHTFCWTCISEYKAARMSSRYGCPVCNKQQESNEPLQLVYVDDDGHLHLREFVLEMYLRSEIKDYPVYLINVIGEKRTGKSFLMNYLMRALRNQEADEKLSLGAEDQELEGFAWKAGTEKVTDGIWIWSKPFILEHNMKKMAIFVLDTEGSMEIARRRQASIQLCVLAMLCSSHLVYNVNSNLKEADTDYLELYSSVIGSNPILTFKYFDILIRNWHDSENVGADVAQTYLAKEIENLRRKNKHSTVFHLLGKSYTKCFLMPHPGKAIMRGNGKLIGMDGDFRESLTLYLSDVVKRTKSCITSADSRTSLTCSDMIEKVKVLMKFIQNTDFNTSSPLEMCHKLKNLEKKKEIQERFRYFIQNQTWWRFPHQMSVQVSEKSQELLKEFEESFLRTNDQDQRDQVEELQQYLEGEGGKFCASHKKGLLLKAVPAVIALGVAAAPAAVGGMVAAPVAAAASPTVLGVIGGAAAMLQAGAGVLLRRWI